MSTALDVLLWLLVGLGFLILTVIWAVILVASVTTIMRFIQQYKITSAQMEKEELGEDEGPPLRF